MKMKYLALVFALFASAAGAQQLVNCAPLTPCTLSGPANTGTGDQAWFAFGKVNSDISTLWSNVITSPDGSISFGGTQGTGVTGEVNASAITTGVTPVAHGGTGTATPGLIAGTNISLAGSWPNTIVNNTCGNVNEQTVSYLIQASDNCNVVVINDHFATAGVTLPTPPTPPFKVTVVNQSSSFSMNVTPTSGSIIYYGTTQTSLWMPSNTSCDFISDGTNFNTSACNSLNNPAGVGNPLTVVNTAGDTVLDYVSSAFNSTAGSPNISFGRTLGGNLASATIVVGGCGQLVAAPPISVTTAGTGYATGDTVTMVPSTGGSDDGTHHLILTVTWQIGGVIQAISGTNTRAGVEVTGNGGNITTWPTSGTFVQSATSGSGTGLVVNMTEAALPLATTIQSGFSGGSTIPLNANCSQTIVNGTEPVAWGHDDQPGITAAIATYASTVQLPANHTYGIRSPIVLNTSTNQSIDCQGSTIVALSSMASMFNLPTNGSIFQTLPQNGLIKNCNLEGMGVATTNILNGANWMSFEHVGLRDATQANLEVNTVGGGGTVVLNNRYEVQINNSALLVPNFPIYCVWLATSHATDNQFVPGEIWNGCQQAGVYDQAASTFYNGVHIYGVVNGPDFLFAGGGGYFLTNLYADGPVGSYCGIQFTGSGIDGVSLTGWKTAVSSSNNLMNQGGVCAGQGSGGTIVGGNFSGVSTLIAAGNGCQFTGSAANSNYIYGNDGCPNYQNALTPTIFGFNSQGTVAGNATTYCALSGGACSTSSTQGNITLPIGGTLQNLYVNTVGDLGTSNTAVITLSTSSGSPTVTCTITGIGSGNDSCNDVFKTTAHSFFAAAGSTVQIKIVTSASASAVRFYGGLEMLTAN